MIWTERLGLVVVVLIFAFTFLLMGDVITRTDERFIASGQFALIVGGGVWVLARAVDFLANGPAKRRLLVTYTAEGVRALDRTSHR